MNKYAVVMTCTTNLIKCLNVAINGLCSYGNEVDIHVLSYDLPKGYLLNLPSNCVCPDTIPYIKMSGKKPKPWLVKFNRYKYAATLKNYDAVMLLDADCTIVSNIMENFEQAAVGEKMLLPRNTRGHSLDKADKFGPDVIKGAASPPYHCHPFFFSPNKFGFICDQVFEMGLNNNLGDMATLYRVLAKNGLHRSHVHMLPGQLYVFTDWVFDRILYSTNADGDPILRLEPIRTKDLEANAQMRVIHRRWALPAIRYNYLTSKGTATPNELQTNNMRAIINTIRYFDEKGPAHWEPYLDSATIEEWNRYENI